MRILGVGARFWGKVVLLLCVYCGMAVPALAQVAASISDGARSTDGNYTIKVTTSRSCNGSSQSYCKYVIQERKNSGEWQTIGEPYDSTQSSYSLTVSRGAAMYAYKACVIAFSCPTPPNF